MLLRHFIFNHIITSPALVIYPNIDTHRYSVITTLKSTTNIGNYCIYHTSTILIYIAYFTLNRLLNLVRYNLSRHMQKRAYRLNKWILFLEKGKNYMNTDITIPRAGTFEVQ